MKKTVTTYNEFEAKLAALADELMLLTQSVKAPEDVDANELNVAKAHAREYILDLEEALYGEFGDILDDED